MSKHMAKRHKRTVKRTRPTRPLKRARGKKPIRRSKAVTERDQVLHKALVEQQSPGPEVAELELVDLETLGQEPEVVEIFEVEVVGDAEDTGQNDGAELTLENSD